MIQVAFYDTAEDSVFDFAVIIAKKDGKWLLCRHKERTTWEFPGGHREKGERIEDAARRELFEETGAKDYTLQPICAYSCMKQGGDASFGMLYYACSNMNLNQMAFRCPDAQVVDTVRLEGYRLAFCMNGSREEMPALVCCIMRM